MIKYSRIKERKLIGRYITNTHIEALHDRHSDLVKIEKIGNSVEKKPIYSYIFGTGITKILVWSQMHGNESTTTKAIFDFFNCLHLKDNEINKLLDSCTFCIIPILNPDGASYYTRLNANKVDLNRDAQALTQPESVVLHNVYNLFNPNYCFNLHGQRTIFSAGFSANSSVLSFLSPSENKQRSITTTRKKAMEVIVHINDALQHELPNQISRYTDDFNLNCVGDTFQSLKTPTILFEAGHYPDDYSRETTRKYVFKSLLIAFSTIANVSRLGDNYQTYFKLPENEKLFFDVIIRNVKNEFQEIIDIAIQFEEVLNKNKINFIPKLIKIGDLEEYFGHKEFDADNEKITINNSIKTPKLLSIVHQIQVNNENSIESYLFSC